MDCDSDIFGIFDVKNGNDFNPFDSLLSPIASQYDYYSTKENEGRLSIEEATKIVDELFAGYPPIPELFLDNDFEGENDVDDINNNNNNNNNNNKKDEKEPVADSEEESDDDDVECVGVKKPKKKKKPSSRKLTDKHFPTIFTKKRRAKKNKNPVANPLLVAPEIIDLTEDISEDDESEHEDDRYDVIYDSDSSDYIEGDHKDDDYIPPGQMELPSPCKRARRSSVCRYMNVLQVK